MVPIYARRVADGFISLEQVPERIRGRVAEALAAKED